MLSGPSQVLLRNADIFSRGKWLLVNPTEQRIFSELPNTELWGFHQYFDVYETCAAQNTDKHSFSAFFEGDTDFDGIVIHMPKAKAQLKMLVDNLQHHLCENGCLMLVGENNSGVKSAAKLLAVGGGKPNKVDSARHCSLFNYQLPSTPDQPESAPFNPTSWLSRHDIKVGERELTLCSLPGVFSNGELDPATELLLTHLPERISGRTLDFGCGAGAIGSFIAKHYANADVVMCDVSALALYSSQKTAEANGITVNIHASNGLNAVRGKAKWVFTNPPFHTGVKTDYSVTEGFLRQLPRHGQDNSQLFLVANSFLQYTPIMESSLKKTQVAAQTSKFRLYHCQIK